MKDDKYIVFKRGEFEEWLALLAVEHELPFTSGDIPEMPSDLEDATVIRGQDLFAAPALDAYAAMIGIVMKFGGMTPETRKELQQAADYFHDRANESRDIAFKTPDNGGLR
jgi:hypothetical protein